MPAKRRDVTGERFGGVVVTSFSHYDGHYTHWNIICDTCGEEKTMYLQSLTRQPPPKSCGCQRRGRSHWNGKL